MRWFKKGRDKEKKHSAALGISLHLEHLYRIVSISGLKIQKMDRKTTLDFKKIIIPIIIIHKNVFFQILSFFTSTKALQGTQFNLAIFFPYFSLFFYPKFVSILLVERSLKLLRNCSLISVKPLQPSFIISFLSFLCFLKTVNWSLTNFKSCESKYFNKNSCF